MTVVCNMQFDDIAYLIKKMTVKNFYKYPCGNCYNFNFSMATDARKQANV